LNKKEHEARLLLEGERAMGYQSTPDPLLSGRGDKGPGAPARATNSFLVNARAWATTLAAFLVVATVAFFGGVRTHAAYVPAVSLVGPEAFFQQHIKDVTPEWDAGLAPEHVQVSTAELGDVPTPQPIYIYIPELDAERYETRGLRKSWEAALPSAKVLKLPGVYPGAWPKGGRLAEAEAAYRRHMLPVPEDFQNDQGLPWWWKGQDLRKRSVLKQGSGASNSAGYLQGRDVAGHSTLDKGMQHHQGASLSHQLAYMTALDKGFKYVIYAESDFAPPAELGSVPEFENALKAAIKHARGGAQGQQWDLIYLDKNTRGAVPGKGPLTTMRSAEWSRDYVLHKWVGNGMAGAGLYLASEAFHGKIVRVMHAYGLVMVDAWIGGQCLQGSLRCYSLFGVPKAQQQAQPQPQPQQQAQPQPHPQQQAQPQPHPQQQAQPQPHPQQQV